MANPFNNQNNGNFMPNNAMTNQQAIALMMQQALQMGSDKFIKQICSRNPQAKLIYDGMLKSGNPTEFYFNMMQQRGMNREQATQFANQNGIKL